MKKVASIWVAAIIALLPVLLHWSAPTPRTSANIAAAFLTAIVGAWFCFYCYKAECKRLSTAQSASLQILIVIQACIAVFLHHYLVDQASGFSSPTNVVWQTWVHTLVVQLSPTVLPHSYRFLPNAIVLWMQMGHVSFLVASQIYRVLAALVMYYALYRYARLYISHRAAIVTLLLVGLVYPTSFVGYGGQLTDPLSHLSFILAFFFLETEDFPLLITTLLIGSLAKETVLALAGFYVLFCRRQKHYMARTAILCVSVLAVYFAVRVFVLHGSMQYQQVSGITLSHVRDNVFGQNWIPHVVMTAFPLAPFLYLGWRRAPVSLRQMVLYLAPVLFISSLFFSWLQEARNFMPLVFVMAVIAGRYLEEPQSTSAST